MNILKYKYYDTPEGHDILYKAFAFGKYGFITGVIAGAYDTLMYSHTKGFVNTAGRFMWYVGPLVGMTVGFTAVANISQNIRGKNDGLNYCIGGAVSGAIFSAWLRSGVIAVPSMVVCASVALIKKAGVDGDWTFLPVPAQATKTIKSVKHDWTISKDVEELKTWTTGIPLESPTADLRKFFTTRIVGGTQAADGSAPYMAAMVFGNFQYLMCGSFIATPRVVVTAAHCIDVFVTWNGQLMSSLRLLVGTNAWQNVNVRGKGVAYEVRGYRNHPRWDPIMIKYDIGVFFVTKEIVLNERTKVLPVSYDWVGGNQKVFVNGWGLTNPMIHDVPQYLQFLQVWTIDHEDCALGVREAVGDWGWAPPVEKHAELCTVHSIGHGMCNGDSGSPLVLASSNKAVGIVSWGFPCATGAPDVFTRVGEMEDFLEPIFKNCTVHNCL